MIRIIRQANDVEQLSRPTTATASSSSSAPPAAWAAGRAPASGVRLFPSSLLAFVVLTCFDTVQWLWIPVSVCLFLSRPSVAGSSHIQLFSNVEYVCREPGFNSPGYAPSYGPPPDAPPSGYASVLISLDLIPTLTSVSPHYTILHPCSQSESRTLHPPLPQPPITPIKRPIKRPTNKQVRPPTWPTARLAEQLPRPRRWGWLWRV